MQPREEQQQQVCDDYSELQFKYIDFLEESAAKVNSMTELKEEVKATIVTCNRVTRGSVEAL